MYSRVRSISCPPSTPSFRIAGTVGSAAPPLRWDQINSQLVLQAGRKVLFQYQLNWPGGPEPSGVVLNPPNLTGRVVFGIPVLLPEEQFVAIDWLRGRPQRSSRNR